MLYLAQVQRRYGKPKLLLAARKRIDNIWMALSLPEILLDLPSNYEHLGEGILMLAEIVEVENKQQIAKLTPALHELVRLLQDYSTRVAKSDTQIKEWKDSVEEQGREFYLRKQKYEKWLEVVKKDPHLLEVWEHLCKEEQEEMERLISSQ